MPLAKPATFLRAPGVYQGVERLPLSSHAQHQRLFTMQLRVAQFLNNYGVSNMRYAAGVIISALPTIILYILGRWILKGTLAGALKVRIQ